jgi:hypothetical protein
VRTGIGVQLLGVAAGALIIGVRTGWMALAGPLVLFGLGAGLASSQLTNIILSRVGRDRAGSASGVATTNNAVAAALGIAVIGTVLRAGSLTDATSARWALAAAAALLLAGSVASSAIPRLAARGPHRAHRAHGADHDLRPMASVEA